MSVITHGGSWTKMLQNVRQGYVHNVQLVQMESRTRVMLIVME
jgi:hypothetical protein